VANSRNGDDAINNSRTATDYSITL